MEKKKKEQNVKYTLQEMRRPRPGVVLCVRRHETPCSGGPRIATPRFLTQGSCEIRSIVVQASKFGDNLFYTVNMKCKACHLKGHGLFGDSPKIHPFDQEPAQGLLSASGAW